MVVDLLDRIKTSLLAGQHGHPTGLVGRIVGEQMVRQHVPETTWTLSLLNLEQTNHVLEIGFGAGRAIELAASQTPEGHVYGIDISQAMVRAATHRNAQWIKAGRVTLHHGDMITLPFADSQFDKVFSIQTLYFWSDPLQVLTEIFRVLKPGGKLIVTLSNGTLDGSLSNGLERYQQFLEEQIIPGMKQIGFTQADIKQGPLSRHYKTTAVIGSK